MDVDKHDNRGMLSCLWLGDLMKSLKVGVDWKRSDQLLFSLKIMCSSLLFSVRSHWGKPSSSLSFCLSVSLSNSSFNQRIGPKSGSNNMTDPIAMEIMSACWRNGLFWSTPWTQQPQYSLAFQSQCPLPCIICQNFSIYLITEVVFTLSLMH